jgi:uncharacterized membrane protein YdjX (TVP38/TMEM64 family)
VTRASGWARLALLALLVVGVGLVLASGPPPSVAAIQERLDAAGRWAPAAFVALYAIASLLFVPGSLLSLAGGALFGPIWGVVINLAGATAGAVLAFLAARYIAGDAMTRRVGPRLRDVIAGVEAEGWRFVAVVRLVPLVPFNLLNYALGLTRIRLVPYAAATAVCMVPGAIAYTWAGHAGRDVAARGTEAWPQLVPALGALVAVALLPRLVRRVRRASIDGSALLQSPRPRV